jgi:hypothetical protein
MSRRYDPAETFRKSNVLSRRRGARRTVERVVRVAVVDGGRVDGFGRRGEAGIRIERCVASVRGVRRRRRAVMYIAAVWRW